MDDDLSLEIWRYFDSDGNEQGWQWCCSCDHLGLGYPTFRVGVEALAKHYEEVHEHG